jgi:acetylornithine deacetylase
MNVENYVDEKTTLELAKTLVTIPSFTGQETECAEFLAEFMEQRGFITELQQVQKGRFQVVGRVRGSGKGRNVMFNGHLDVDGVRGNQQRDPWNPTIENGRLYGHGIWNMKAGVASMVMAANAVLQSGVELSGDIIVAGVVGELQGGVGTVYLLEKGVTADMAVVTEATGLNIMTMHAGILEMMITTTGISKHILEKENAVNALTKMIKVINALENVQFTCMPMPELPGLPRLLVGSIIGGLGKDYKLFAYESPDRCSILVDIRFLPTQTKESVLNDIQTALHKLQREDPELNYEITLPPLPFNADQVIMPPHNLSKDELIVKIVEHNHEYVTGKPVNRVGALTTYPYAMSYTGDDDAHLYGAGIPAICYGPGYPPRRNEPSDQYVEISQITTCAKVLARTAHEICAPKLVS